jgi:hypothetical protein
MTDEILKEQDSLNEGPLELITPVRGHIDINVVKKRNREKSWAYGYNKEYDFVVISKDGMIGSLVRIQGLLIALPVPPDDIYSRSKKAEEQYWERKELPKELARIKSMSVWVEMPSEFKRKWVDYIELEFDRRELGYWFMNNGVKTYITGSHYMYLQWSSIDVGHPDFREANRALFLHWEACKADSRCFGQLYVKIRRSGFSFMASSEAINIGTLTKNARIGILSKTGEDAKKMFTDKVVHINNKLPFFFRPVQDGMDKPKTELSFRVPAVKITKKNMSNLFADEVEGLNTTIDWKNTGDNSYDGEKLRLLVQDESGKWLKPNNITNNWKVTKTCLRLGNKVVGKCMMGSTCNAMLKGGKEFKQLYMESDVEQRNSNGNTKSGLYNLFIPMEWNMEGFIDMYGMPVLRAPEKPIKGIDGEMISSGAIDYWENEVSALKSDPDNLNEFYRQFPRTIGHAFRDESRSSLFNLTKIYQQVDYNDSIVMSMYVTRGSFKWADGLKDSKVVWTPDSRGRFLVSWLPAEHLRNRVIKRNDMKMPGNEHIGAFGCDSYDISGVVDGSGSNGSLHGKTGYHMDNAPTNAFFLEYISRPPTAEIFYEDVLMACVFYGMPILVENNKPRLLYHFKNRGYRKFCMNRPDRTLDKLSKTERELGGIPNSSEDVKQAHASAIEAYIEKFVGYDYEGTYRNPDDIGDMFFNRTLEDWARFDINDRTKHDASISSGLAIMATQKHLYQPEVKQSKISVKFATYNNTGATSKIIRHG